VHTSYRVGSWCLFVRGRLLVLVVGFRFGGLCVVMFWMFEGCSGFVCVCVCGGVGWAWCRFSELFLFLFCRLFWCWFSLGLVCSLRVLWDLAWCSWRAAIGLDAKRFGVSHAV